MPLTVATWNCAHGRGVGPDLRRLGRRRRRETLERIGRTLDEEGVDVVALQESDGPSWWSGGFDHRRTVADAGRFAHGVQGHHVHVGGLRYGTALLGRHPLTDPRVVHFDGSFPTPRKGFVAATVALDGQPIDVVSVHLDFARGSVRRRQLERLARHLAQSQVPSVVMGDFNDVPDGVELSGFARDVGLTTVDDATITFRKLRRRLDVVWTSPGLLLDRYRVLPVDLSDHRPVLARVQWS